MDGYLEILVFLLSVCQGLCLNGTLLYFNGCMPAWNLTTYENNSLSYVEHNYPALCLQICIQNNHDKPVAIALQYTKCICLNRTNHVEKLGGSTDCSELCPGHDELYCGNKTADSYSAYGASPEAIRDDEEELCAAEKINGSIFSRTMQNCSRSYRTICHSLAITDYCEERKSASNWSQEIQTCPFPKPQYNPYGNKTNNDCHSGLDRFLTSIYWIPAFVKCETLFELKNGNTTFLDNPRIIEHSCEDGYELQPKGSSIRICMTNGKWNGTTPICKRLSTTTSQAVNNVTGPLTTGLTTGISAAAPKQTSAVTKPPGSIISASLTVSTSSSSNSSSKLLVQTTSFQTTEVSESIFNQTTESNSSSAAAAESKSDTRTTVTVGIVVGVIGFLLFCAVLAAGIIFYCKHKRKHKVAPANSYGIKNMEEDDNQGLSTVQKSSP